MTDLRLDPSTAQELVSENIGQSTTVSSIVAHPLFIYSLRSSVMRQFNSTAFETISKDLLIRILQSSRVNDSKGFHSKSGDKLTEDLDTQTRTFGNHALNSTANHSRTFGELDQEVVDSVAPKTRFVEHSVSIRIEGSESLIDCRGCLGKRSVPCLDCRGTGCRICGESGTQKCAVCGAIGKIREFGMANLEFRNVENKAYIFGNEISGLRWGEKVRNVVSQSFPSPVAHKIEESIGEKDSFKVQATESLEDFVALTETKAQLEKNGFQLSESITDSIRNIANRFSKRIQKLYPSKLERKRNTQYPRIRFHHLLFQQHELSILPIYQVICSQNGKFVELWVIRWNNCSNFEALYSHELSHDPKMSPQKNQFYPGESIRRVSSAANLSSKSLVHRIPRRSSSWSRIRDATNSIRRREKDDLENRSYSSRDSSAASGSSGWSKVSGQNLPVELRPVRLPHLKGQLHPNAQCLIQ